MPLEQIENIIFNFKKKMKNMICGENYEFVRPYIITRCKNAGKDGHHHAM